ncbi:MAG: response regulator [Clostridiaceae bacterium]|nr:response regulator [Clostridiaceae bacterium]
MLKIMIVDDEFYFREAIKISLPWNELGFEICGEAKNGRDALEKVAAIKPEIIIVDINMPIMDGLEFVQHLRETNNDIKIIILTGHSEFNYARQAVKLGVFNYLLKPVDEEELKKTLLDLRNIINKENRIKMEMDRLMQQVRASMPLLKDKFLNELLRGNLSKKDSGTIKRMEYLKINSVSDYYLAVTIEVDTDEDFNWDDEDKQLWKFAVSNITDEILSEGFVFDRCYDNDDRICIIIGANDDEDRNTFLSGLEYKLEWLRSIVAKYMDFSVTIGVGEIRDDLFDIAESYKESIVALKNKVTLGKNKVILYSSVAEPGIKVNLFTVEQRSQLLMSMRIANEKEVDMCITQIFERMRCENIHYEMLFVACIELISVCFEFIIEVGASLEDIFPDKQLGIIEKLQLKKSINDMEEWIKEIYRHTLETIKKNKSSKASKTIEEVKNYIGENYQNYELNIDEIARNLFINYAHLCFIFKRDTGVTINEYLTEFRIRKAKDLFDSGNTLIHDVASKVGYADANYFGKCFKKFYGIPPSKYLENINRN